MNNFWFFNDETIFHKLSDILPGISISNFICFIWIQPDLLASFQNADSKNISAGVVYSWLQECLLYMKWLQIVIHTLQTQIKNTASKTVDSLHNNV